MATKKKKLADSVEVRLAGSDVPVSVIRGDMSDEEWSKTVAAVQKQEADSLESAEEGGDGKPATAGKSYDWPELLRLGEDLSSVSDDILTPREKELLKGASKHTSAEFLRQRLSHRGVTVPKESIEAVRAVEESKPAQVEQPVARSSARNPAIRGKSIRDNLDAAKRASGEGDKKLASQFANQAKQLIGADNTYSKEFQEANTFIDANRDTSESSEGGGTLGSKVRSMVGKSTRGVTLPEMDMSNEGTMVMPELDISPTDAEETKFASQRLADTVKEDEAEAFMRDGLDLTTPESRLSDAVQTRLGQPAGPDVTVEEGGVSPTVTANDDVTSRFIRPQSVGGPIVADEGVAPPEPSLIDNISRGVTELRNEASAAVTGVARTMGNMSGVGGVPAQTLGDPLDDAVPPAQVQPAAPGVMPPPAGGSASMSLKTKGGVPTPAARPDRVSPIIDEQRMLLDGAATLEADAVAKKTDIDRQRLIATKQLQERALSDAEKMGEQRAAAQAAYSKTLSDGQSSLASIMSERRDLLNQRVDPDRYWNDAGAGRKVAAVLAGALFGWNGQGMNYLQHLQGLVDRDVRLQQDELKRRGGIYDDLIGDQRNIIAIAKERGLSDIAAVEAAKAARYEEIEQQMQMLATEAGIQGQNPALAQTLAGIAAKKAEAIGNVAAFTQQKAHQDSQTALGWAKLRQDQAELQFRQTKGGGKDGQELKPQQTARIASLLNVGKSLKRMSESYSQKTGPASAVTQYMGGGVGLTDASDWRNSGQRFYAKTIGPEIEGGKLTGPDEEAFMESFIPKAGDIESTVQFKKQSMVDRATDKYVNELQALEAGDYRTHGLPSPEQFRAQLMRDAGLTESKPLPGETARP